MTRASRWSVLLALVLAGCATPLRTDPRPMTTVLEGPVVTVPMLILRDLPLVEVDVAGLGPRWFVVDTGAQFMVVSERLAAELRVGIEERTLSVAGAEETTEREVGFAALPELRLGGAVFRGVTAAVLDFADLRAALGADLAGVLNFPLFSHGLLTLDYPRSELRLAVGHLEAADGEDTLVYRSPRGTPQIDVSLGGHPVTVTLDSGDNRRLAISLADADRLPFTHGPVPGPVSATVNGLYRSRLGRLDADLLIGRHRIVRPVVSLTAQSGRLGSALLRHFRVTFDQGRGLVRFDRPSDDPVHVPPYRSFGFQLARTATGWEVADVVPMTPADQRGLRVGDRVVSIDGRDPAAVTEAAWDALVEAEGRMRVGLVRDDGPLTLEIDAIALVP